ncbi:MULTISPECIES: anti-sigma factor [Alteromonas]|uniref:anti-sigma factor n=1 Tax=Alteromonas TaxID=226 RepID=UPI00235786FC|nr:anti-sigma factor [Alteromonas australica]|tara:strand:- start:370 stop:1104 length:735 start_codon:yes stop_codon:yes gene_type:complete
MNYLKEERLNALAAEYVVGTLRGKARTRYQKLMMQYQAVSDATAQWEQYLTGFAETLPPVTPPANVWESIQIKLGHKAANDAGIATGVNTPSDSGQVLDFEKEKQKRWKNLSFLSTAAALVLAVLLFVMQPMPAPEVSHIAVVNNADNTPLWVIEVSDETMNVKVTDAFIALADKDYELWMVPANGEAPISLGLMPEANGDTRVTPDILLSQSIAALAVSLEAPGGSVTGAPTEVLYIAPIVSV